MDWETVIKQQDALEQSFSALKNVFQAVENEFREKRQKMLRQIAENQSREAIALGQIHSALNAIIESNKTIIK